MNYMEQVAHILGVELDEEFNLVGVDLTYKISKDGMKVYNGINDEWRYSSPLLPDILIGKYKIKKSMLTNQDKEYLSTVIKPFRNRVEGIGKYDDGKYKCARIRFRDIYGNREFIFLPSFEKDIQYRGMEADKWYSLKDLEL